MKNKAAVLLAQKSVEKRFGGKTPEEISEMMSKLRKGKKGNKTKSSKAGDKV
jgi:hypothetical protein